MPEECEHDWKELDDLYAITRVEPDGATFRFFPASGIICKAKICKKCAEIKLTYAKLGAKLE